MERAEQDATECVGGFEMRVTIAEPSPEAAERWEQRIEALTAWLLTEWQRQQKEAV
jgi:hypothetical protein